MLGGRTILKKVKSEAKNKMERDSLEHVYIYGFSLAQCFGLTTYLWGEGEDKVRSTGKESRYVVLLSRVSCWWILLVMLFVVVLCFVFCCRLAYCC